MEIIRLASEKKNVLAGIINMVVLAWPKFTKLSEEPIQYFKQYFQAS